MKKIFTYPRADKLNDTIGLPVLVVISDASERAFGASTMGHFPGGRENLKVDFYVPNQDLRH
jgi:hypothetical protein